MDGIAPSDSRRASSQSESKSLGFEVCKKKKKKRYWSLFFQTIVRQPKRAGSDPSTAALPKRPRIDHSTGTAARSARIDHSCDCPLCGFTPEAIVPDVRIGHHLLIHAVRNVPSWAYRADFFFFSVTDPWMPRRSMCVFRLERGLELTRFRWLARKEIPNETRLRLSNLQSSLWEHERLRWTLFGGSWCKLDSLILASPPVPCRNRGSKLEFRSSRFSNSSKLEI